MATKKRSASSPRAQRVSVSAESIFSKPLGKKQKDTLRQIAKRQAAGGDSAIDFSDIPELTAEELRKARRAPKVLVAARIDRDVYDWLQGYGEGYSTRINAILRAVMSTGRRIA
jgi:uncharacterized protein (DUF4415 family)